MLESGAYRYPLILLRDEERFSSVTVSASAILSIRLMGLDLKTQVTLCGLYLCSYLCTIRMQVGAAVFDRAKSRGVHKRLSETGCIPH